MGCTRIYLEVERLGLLVSDDKLMVASTEEEEIGKEGAGREQISI